jgi:hypothetical protein
MPALCEMPASISALVMMNSAWILDLTPHTLAGFGMNFRIEKGRGKENDMNLAIFRLYLTYINAGYSNVRFYSFG